MKSRLWAVEAELYLWYCFPFVVDLLRNVSSISFLHFEFYLQGSVTLLMKHNFQGQVSKVGCAREDKPECVFLIRSMEALFSGLSGGQRGGICILRAIYLTACARFYATGKRSTWSVCLWDDEPPITQLDSAFLPTAVSILHIDRHQRHAV